MASLVNKDSPSVPIKAVEIQSTTHVDIIALGNDVFQKNNQKQWQEFNTKLNQHEMELKNRLDDERKVALDQLRAEHGINIEKLKHRYAVLMDDALKEEAERMKSIMEKIATESLEAERLEGQRKLDESLKKAREDFDIEKAEAIMQVTLEHEERQKKREQEMKVEHNERVDKLNKEWESKLKEQSEQALLHEHETLEFEREVAKRKYDDLLKEALKAAEKRHADEIDKLNVCIEDKKLEGIHLQNNIQSLNASIDKKNEELKNIMAAFQRFVDQSPGFSPGQSEFVLDHLIPDGFDEFISSSG